MILLVLLDKTSRPEISKKEYRLKAWIRVQIYFTTVMTQSQLIFIKCLDASGLFWLLYTFSLILVIYLWGNLYFYPYFIGEITDSERWIFLSKDIRLGKFGFKPWQANFRCYLLYKLDVTTQFATKKCNICHGKCIYRIL